MHKSFHHKTSLDDLPVEIILEVASHLDLEDIHSLQQTNKKLRKSINVPVVWRALAKTYSARHFHIYQPQSGGFNDLTEHELSKWIRKRLDFNRSWKVPTLQLRIRAFTVDPYLTFKLVPGGRWLLATAEGASVWYYDLDSEEPEQKVLIQPSEDIEGSDQDIAGLEINVEVSTSGLHFDLVLRTKGDPSPTPIMWLHVWRVKIKGGCSLAAEWLASVPTPSYFVYAYSLAIGQNLVALTRDRPGGPSLVEIYWWKQCSTTSGFLRSHFLAHLNCDTAYLFGDDRILFVNRGGNIVLYDIPEPEQIGIGKNLVPREDIPNPLPIWSYTLWNPGGISHSPLYHDGATYRFVLSSSGGILGFTIPAIKDHTPSTIWLSRYFESGSICVPGLYKAYVLYDGDGDESGVRIGYDWESGVSAATTYTRGELRGCPHYYIKQPAFDEESGRFLYDQDGEVFILDFLTAEY